MKHSDLPGLLASCRDADREGHGLKKFAKSHIGNFAQNRVKIAEKFDNVALFQPGKLTDIFCTMRLLQMETMIRIARITALCLTFSGPLLADQVTGEKTKNIQEIGIDLIQSADRVVVLYDRYAGPSQDEDSELPEHLITALSPSMKSLIEEIKSAKMALLGSVGLSRKHECEKALEKFDNNIFNEYIKETSATENGRVSFTYSTVIKSMAVSQYFVLYTIRECIGE